MPRLTLCHLLSERDIYSGVLCVCFLKRLLCESACVHLMAETLRTSLKGGRGGGDRDTCHAELASTELRASRADDLPGLSATEVHSTWHTFLHCS